MTSIQNHQLNKCLAGHSCVTVAQIGNLIESAIEGQTATARVKASEAWQRLDDEQKQALSKLMDKWIYQEHGGAGTLTDASVRAYYDSSCTHSPIMPARLIV